MAYARELYKFQNSPYPLLKVIKTNKNNANKGPVLKQKIKIALLCRKKLLDENQPPGKSAETRNRPPPEALVILCPDESMKPINFAKSYSLCKKILYGSNIRILIPSNFEKHVLL